MPADEPNPASGSTDIRVFLGRVRSRLRRHDGVRALLWGIAALLALGLLMPLVALLMVGPRTTAVALLAGGSLIAFLVALGGVVLGVVVPLRRWRSDAAIARYVGERDRTVASDLLSSVQLAPSGDDAPPAIRRGAPSPALVDALVDATARRVRTLEPQTLVPGRPLRHAALACLGALLVHGAVMLVSPRPVVDGWRRMLERPHAPFGGAVQTPTPLVGDLRVTLDFPAYTRRPRAELPSSSGEFRAMPGTTITLETRSLLPITSATVILERDPDDRGAETPAAERVPMERDGERLRARFVVRGAARYRFEVQRPDRARLVELMPRHIEIESDQTPAVQLLAPAEDLDVTSMKRVELGVTAEDDHGIRKVELVWTSGGTTSRKLLEVVKLGVDGRAPSRVQAKVVWDLAEIALPPGARVDYHVEVTDNDDVLGPNVGTSRQFHLRVFSPRERHEQNLERQQEVAEKMLRVLGGRLTHVAAGGDDLAVRDELRRATSEIIVELGTLVAAYDKDPQADKRLRVDLEAMRGRLDKLTASEARIVDKLPRKADPARASKTGSKFSAVDRPMVAELEDDVLALSDWLDRERLETLLDVADEIAAHRKRLDQLLEEYARTGDPKLKAEIDRELRALEQRLDELARKRAGMTADVLDQFVNQGAMQDKQADGCIAQVRALMAKGAVAEAQAKLAECGKNLDAAAGAMESALEQLRGDKFSAEQQKLDELMNDLADLAQDQTDIAAEADQIYERYADKADQLMADLGKEARKKLSATVDKLRDRIAAIPQAGLTPFAQEELDIVERRLADLEHMLEVGDLAEALGMARQAKQSLDTVSAELEAALEDDPNSPWAHDTGKALEAVERAHPPADKLVEELAELAPSPDKILDGNDKKALDRLRRRQKLNEDHARKLAERARQLTPDLPGNAGEEISSRVDDGARKMGQAEGRMKARDPSGARDAARSAADALDKARERARAAARQQQSDGGAGLDAEPIRIPGAEEYKAPEHFREDILEAMKKKAPEGYDQMIRRYYEELIR